MPDSHALASTPPKPSRHWGRWLLLGLGVLILLVIIALQLLDPWLKRQLEKQVAKQSQGYYRLEVGELHTHLWQRGLELRRLRLRPVNPALPAPPTLPTLDLSLGELRVEQVGLLALLRRRELPIGSILLDSLRLNLRALPAQPKPDPRPLHERLPLRLPGLRLEQFSLQHSQLSYGPTREPRLALGQVDFTVDDLWLSRAGATDTQRTAYAAAFATRLQELRAFLPGGDLQGHHLRLAQLAFASQKQRLTLDSLRVLPPAAGAGKAGAVRVDLVLPRLWLTHLSPARLQHQQRFAADSLVLQRPHLTVTPPKQPPPDLWKLLRPYLRRADLAQLHVSHGFVRVAGLAHDPVGRDITITGRGFRIDSAGAFAPQRILYAQAWTAHTGRLTGAVSPPIYRASIEHLDLSTAARSWRLRGLRLEPRRSPAALNRLKGYQIPQIGLRLAALQAQGCDFPRLARRGQLYLSRLRAVRPQLTIASDGRGPINPHRSVITPEAIRRIPFRLDLGRLDLEDGALYCRYRSPRSPLVGKLRITRFNLSLRNFSNDPAQTAAHPLTGQATAYLEGRCRVEAHVEANLRDPQGRHRVWGSFGPAPFALINPMTAPSRLIRFDKGQVSRIQFSLTADQKQVQGQMRAEYRDLKLSLLAYKEEKLKKPLLTRVGSKLANVLVIRDQNPRKRGKLVVGEMSSRREPRFSVFALWRQGLVSGLLHSIGLPQQLAQKISQQQDKAPLPPK